MRAPSRSSVSGAVRTFKDFYADHGPAGSIEELRALCDQFRCTTTINSATRV